MSGINAAFAASMVAKDDQRTSAPPAPAFAGPVRAIPVHRWLATFGQRDRICSMPRLVILGALNRASPIPLFSPVTSLSCRRAACINIGFHTNWKKQPALIQLAIGRDNGSLRLFSFAVRQMDRLLPHSGPYQGLFAFRQAQL